MVMMRKSVRPSENGLRKGSKTGGHLRSPLVIRSRYAVASCSVPTVVGLAFALLAVARTVAAAATIAVTHAAGRMGVSAVGQLHEAWQLAPSDEPLQIRAVVRSTEFVAGGGEGLVGEIGKLWTARSRQYRMRFL